MTTFFSDMAFLIHIKDVDGSGAQTCRRQVTSGPDQHKREQGDDGEKSTGRYRVLPSSLP